MHWHVEVKLAPDGANLYGQSQHPTKQDAIGWFIEWKSRVKAMMNVRHAKVTYIQCGQTHEGRL